MLRQLKMTPKVDPVVIPLVHVIPFLRSMVVREAGEKLLAREAAKLEKASYLVRQFPSVGPLRKEI